MRGTHMHMLHVLLIINTPPNFAVQLSTRHHVLQFQVDGSCAVRYCARFGLPTVQISTHSRRSR